MFSKSNDNESDATDSRIEPRMQAGAEKPPSSDFQMRSVSYVGPGLSFSGDVEVHEGLVIEGEIDGSITSEAKTLTVGKQGRIEGKILGNTVEIRGNVSGDVYGHTLVRLHSTAVIEGAVYCRRIIMDEGAILNGTVDMNWQAEKTAKGKLTTVDNTGDSVAQAAS